MSELRTMHRRVMNMVARGVIAETDDKPGMQNVQVSLLHEEAKVAVERMQNYGISGVAPRDSEVTVVFIGGGRDHGVIVATESRASRFTDLKEGEVAVYTDEGDSIVLKRDNTIEVTTNHLTIKCDADVKIECQEATITVDNAIEINASDIMLNGNVTVNGNLTMGNTGAANGDSTIEIKGNIVHDGNHTVTKTITADTVNAPHGHVGP